MMKSWQEYVAKIAVLALSTISMALPLSGARAAQSFATAVVVDSSGKQLGPYVDYGYALIQLAPGQASISVPVLRAGFYLSLYSNAIVGWVTSDCSGTAYVNAEIPLRTGFSYTNSLYFPDVSATPQALRMVSWRHNGKCRAIRRSLAFFASAVPAKPIAPSTLGFTPPFRVELR